MTKTKCSLHSGALYELLRLVSYAIDERSFYHPSVVCLPIFHLPIYLSTHRYILLLRHNLQGVHNLNCIA